MRRKSRLFALAEALRALRTGVTALQLADRFDITLRTIYRDLAALPDAGIPICAERGRAGGYALDKSYQLPPVNFTAREAALLVALCRLATEQRRIPFLEAASLQTMGFFEGLRELAGAMDVRARFISRSWTGEGRTRLSIRYAS